MSLLKKKTAREEALEAAWHLFLEQGEKPSTAKVRQIVQRGSDSHLNEGVNAFWDELKAKAQQWHAFPKDADFLMPLVSKLLDDVLRKAHSAYEDQLRDTKQLEVDAKRWIETVDKEKAALEEQLADAQQQLQTRTQQNITLQQSCDTQTREANQLRNELEKKQLECDQLKARNNDLKDAHNQSIEEIEKSAKMREQGLQQQYSARVDEAKKETEQLQAQLKKLQSEWQQKELTLQELLQAGKEKGASLVNSIANLKQENAALTEKRQQLETKLKELANENQTNGTHWREAQTLIAEKERALAESTKKLEQLAAERTQLGADKDTLNRQVMELIQRLPAIAQ